MERRRSEMARVTVSDEFLWQNYLAPFDPSSDANDSGHESSDDESDSDLVQKTSYNHHFCCSFPGNRHMNVLMW